MSTENKTTATKTEKTAENKAQSTASLASALTEAKSNISEVASSAAAASAQEAMALVEQIKPKMEGALNATVDYVYDIQQRLSGELAIRVRSHPIVSIGIAAILGFAISRYLKSK
jgi:ElaB/YqjD/DUF883 family membrane-anchored ribosome-binding protein